jgi:hypothetical protein
MSGSSKEKLHANETTEEVSEEREVYLRDGRKLVVGEAGTDQIVEIRSGSGMLELRIKLTEQGPVLEMEAARLQLKATEAVSIESPTVEIKSTEKLAIEAGKVDIDAKEDIEIESTKDVRVVGEKIHLN